MMFNCIGCGKTYAIMFVAWLLGKEFRCCAGYPQCDPRIRLGVVDRLTRSEPVDLP